MDSKDLDSLLAYFNDKIDLIWNLIPFAKLCVDNEYHDERKKFGKYYSNGQYNNKNNYGNNLFNDSDAIYELSIPDLGNISQLIVEMKTTLTSIKEHLLDERDSLNYQFSIINERKSFIEQHLNYLKLNIPSFMNKKNDELSKKMIKAKIIENPVNSNTNNRALVNIKSNINNNSIKPTNNSNNGVKKKPLQQQQQQQSRKSAPSNNLNGNQKGQQSVKKKNALEEMYKNWPSIKFITLDEFDSIPKYMRGRVTYDMINGAVKDFNQTIEVKYQLMSTSASKHTEDELKRYHEYRSQENAETVGHFFCLIDDFKLISPQFLKGDNNTKIIVTCLRHCKRIKEIRGPAKLIRYAIITES